MSSAPDSSNPTAAAAMTAAAMTAAAGDSSRLEQPNDAVPMESMPKDDLKKEEDNTRPEAALDSESANAAAITTTTAEVAEDKKAGKAPAEPVSSEAKDSTAQISSAEPPSLQTKGRSDSMAIGPAQDEIKAVTPGADDIGPVCNITLLLTSGSRHPYKISARYLTKRNVPIPEETEAGLPDPFSISVYTLKELILREWRSDWEAKPASPSSIRLITFGKLLDDKEALKKYSFVPDMPNVVHMSVRPQDLDEEEPKTGAKNAAHGGADGRRERSGGCCVVL